MKDPNAGSFLMTTAMTTLTDAPTGARNVLPPWETDDNLVNPQERDLARLILRCGIQQVVIALGVPGNLLTLAVFLKQGVGDRINLLLFSLALADLTNLVTQLLQKLTCFMADKRDSANWDILMVPQVAFLNRYANFVSSLLMTIMAVDRCLSVAWPLKASRILSWRKMLSAILLVYAIIAIAYGPNLFLYEVQWRLDPSTNRSIASLATVKNFAFDPSLPLLIGVILAVVIKPLSIIMVIVCSSISVITLRKATKKRQTMQQKQTSEKQSETKVNQMLLFLCAMYIVWVLPDAAGALVIYFVPEFFLYRKHHNLFVVCFEVFFVGSCVNSSVNFFAYLALSTKFRATLVKMIPCLDSLFSVVGRLKRKPGDLPEMST